MKTKQNNTKSCSITFTDSPSTDSVKMRIPDDLLAKWMMIEDGKMKPCELTNAEVRCLDSFAYLCAISSGWDMACLVGGGIDQEKTKQIWRDILSWQGA